MSKGLLSVVHVLPYTPHAPGGHSIAILAMMEAQRIAGIDSRAIAPVSKVPIPRRAEVSARPVQELDFDTNGFCDQILAAAGPQTALFHLHGYIRSFNAVGAALRRRSIPYVVTSHGNLNYRSLSHAIRKLIYVNVSTRFFRGAGGLHFLTERERSRCRMLLPFWGKPVLVQGNVVEAPTPHEVQPLPRGDYGAAENAFVFAFVGRLDIRCKGLDLLLESFARLPGEPVLILIGGDWEGGRSVLEQQASQLGCADRVHFAGSQLGERKWRMLRSADAFVGPSRWESFGLAHAEAMALGLPTIVSSAMNLATELARHQAALISDLSVEALSGAMLRMMQEAALRRSLSLTGRQWVLDHCAAQHAGPEYARFYESLL